MPSNPKDGNSIYTKANLTRLSNGISDCEGPGDQVGAPGGKSPTERRSEGSKTAVKGELRVKLKRSRRGALWKL